MQLPVHVYVPSNLNQEKNSFYLIKGKTYTSKNKKIKSEISQSVYSDILKDRRMIETSALFEFIVNMQEKKKEQRNTACDSPKFA